MNPGDGRSVPAGTRGVTEAVVRIHADNYDVYGYRKVHAALAREGIQVGEDQVRR